MAIAHPSGCRSVVADLAARPPPADGWLVVNRSDDGWEALRHEKYLYLAGAGPYADDDRERILAERLEGLVSQEHATWTEGRHQQSGESKH